MAFHFSDFFGLKSRPEACLARIYVCALNCVALVCLCWYAHVRFGTPVVSLGRRETRRSCGGGGRGRKVCRFNFAELRSRSFSVCAAAPAFCLF